MEEREINEIIEAICEDNFSCALVRDRPDHLMILNKQNHFYMIIEDDEGRDIIIDKLIKLGIEVFPDSETFEKKYSRKPHYPEGFPKDRMK